MCIAPSALLGVTYEFMDGVFESYNLWSPRANIGPAAGLVPRGELN